MFRVPLDVRLGLRPFKRLQHFCVRVGVQPEAAVAVATAFAAAVATALAFFVLKRESSLAALPELELF